MPLMQFAGMIFRISKKDNTDARPHTSIKDTLKNLWIFNALSAGLYLLLMKTENDI